MTPEISKRKFNSMHPKKRLCGPVFSFARFVLLARFLNDQCHVTKVNIKRQREKKLFQNIRLSKKKYWDDWTDFFFCLFFFLCVCFSDFYNLSFRSAYSKYKEKMRAKKNYCVDILCSRPVNIWWRRVKKIGFTMVSMMFHSFSFSIMGSSNWWHTFVFVHLVTVVRFVGIFVVWPFQANYEK